MRSRLRIKREINKLVTNAFIKLKTMKKKNYFMLALAAIAFVACSNEDAITNDVSNSGVIDPEGDAWVALSVQSISKTRGLNVQNINNGTADESTIKAVKAVFFDGHAANSLVTKEVNFTTEDINGLPNRTNAFKIPSTSKSVLIIVNPQNLSLTINPGVTDYQTVNKVVGDITNVRDNVAKSGEFLMTNAKGGLEPSLDNGNPDDLILYKTSSAAESIPLTVRVDRVAAKVRVILDNTGAALSDAATIDEAQTRWFLNVTNKKYFPVSERTQTALKTLTPFDFYNLGSYRIDPNYSGAAIGVWTPGGGGDYDDNYNYVTSATSSIAWSELGGNNPIYCLENKQEENFNVHAYTTQALLKVAYAPKNVENEDGSKVTVNSGDDWFIMNGAFYTQTSILTYIKTELTNKYTHHIPTEYDTPITDSYNEYINAIGLQPVDIYDAITPPAASPSEQAEALVDKFTALNGDISTNSEGGKNIKGVSYYHGGISYYKIMVKHDNKDTDDFMNRLGEFGVVRNSVYDIHINKINNPGYPSIPDPDPATPNEEKDQYLSIKIEVNPWTWYTQVEDL